MKLSGEIHACKFEGWIFADLVFGMQKQTECSRRGCAKMFVRRGSDFFSDPRKVAAWWGLSFPKPATCA